MEKPLFWTNEQWIKYKRQQQSIENDKSGGMGKIFCWHDYTYLFENRNPMERMFGGKYYVVKCVKCGKQKSTSFLPIEPISPLTPS